MRYVMRMKTHSVFFTQAFILSLCVMVGCCFCARAQTPGAAVPQATPDAAVPPVNAAPATPDASEANQSAPALDLRSELPIPIQKEPTLAELDRTHEQQWHRYTARLSGSMCPSCLLELENKLRRFAGVAFAKILRDGTPGSTIDKPRNAFATIIYDSHAIDPERLKTCMKIEKYKALDNLDVELTSK